MEEVRGSNPLSSTKPTSPQAASGRCSGYPAVSMAKSSLLKTKTKHSTKKAKRAARVNKKGGKILKSH